MRRALYLLGLFVLGLAIYFARSLAMYGGLIAAGPPPSGPPPSIVLFVMDTTRFDAVSAYGSVAGTTPTTDTLAVDGLLYTRAYAQAPWTLPSHATLFTGLLPSQHGVGWQRTQAPDSLVMLAERLREAGYHTVGFSENGWISTTFNMAQGFDDFVLVRLGAGGSLEADISNWLDRRRPDRPFFLFVNVIDPHWPYSVRDKNPHLPQGVTAEQAASVSQFWGDYLCAESPRADRLEILEGLYRGDVTAADQKLMAVLDLLKKAGCMCDTVTIVTSDHGEHFGEHGLVNHQFSVREPLIHVPLIVHGVRGATAGVIDEPVQLADIVPTVLEWAKIPIPDALPGRPLPALPGERRAPRVIIAEYYDPDRRDLGEEGALAQGMRRQTIEARAACAPKWRVFGDMRALIQYPFKLTWFEQYPAQLHDLAPDPGESLDIAEDRSDLVRKMVAELHQSVRDRETEVTERATDHRIPDNVRESLEALGYLRHTARDAAR